MIMSILLQMKGLIMNRLVIVLSMFLLGAFLMGGNTENMDEYYNSLDVDSPSISAHKKISDNNRKGFLRKRAYKRKRIRRPPQRGK